MNAQQRVSRGRRNYNRWVANQTLEDFALRFTAKRARKWSMARVSHTALGAISFLALEAIGGGITLSYGFTNAFYAILVVSLLIFIIGLPICYHAAKEGIDIDLLTRGAGFGYIGSTITSLIYACFTFIFFAIECAIMALALQLTMGIPLSVGYILSSLVVIPLVTHGITLISRFQVWSQPLWIVLQLLPLICIALKSDDSLTLWTSHTPTGQAPGFNILAFGAAASVLFSLIAQIGEQVDFLRFLPHQKKPDRNWLTAMVMAGPGWIISGTIKILIGSFLAVLALHHGISAADAADPNQMYLIAFGYLSDSPTTVLILTGVFVILSQLKINVTNAYAGSIAWSNFFSRLTHNHPGRVVWLVFNVAIALLLVELGIYQVLKEILEVYAIVALAWIGSLAADLVINRPLGLRPQKIEFKRGHLYDINPVGVGSVIISSALGFIAHAGHMGELAEALASFIALGSTFICAPLIALLTKGRYYIAREEYIFSSDAEVRCCVCEHHFETEDMTHCPAYSGPICSLCCLLDLRCQDMCKTDSRMSDQLARLLPKQWVGAIKTNIAHFLALFLMMSLTFAGVMALLYFQVSYDEIITRQSVAEASINVYLIFLIVCGVMAWMLVLAHDSRLVAEEESQRQTELLLAEVGAHKKTDQELQKAKEAAEAASEAKSRYLTGISHELRSPMNAIMGYAQLLEKDPQIPPGRQQALKIIRRSSEYQADLIEGLLDISRIEAGRLEFSSDEVQLGAMLEQLSSMFSIQAHSKGIQFSYTRLSPLPAAVRTDAKRLRQILINLLSNAIKYTRSGSVEFSVSYRNQVARFSVRDTGIGIAAADIERIFEPFERVRTSGEPHEPGTGLGLSITALLVDIMGGEIKVESAAGEGSTFRVTLMLPSTRQLVSDTPPEPAIVGYTGKERVIFVVDDEPAHRQLLIDMLKPLGFKVIFAPDGRTCLDMLENSEIKPDTFLLDIFMPGMSGWSLALAIRARFPDTVIHMISANANQEPPPEVHPSTYNGYLVKPLQLPQLLDLLATHSHITWVYSEHPNQQPASATTTSTQLASINSPTPSQGSQLQTGSLSPNAKSELIALCKIGYAKAITKCLDKCSASHEIDPALDNQLRELTSQFRYSDVIQLLEKHA